MPLILEENINNHIVIGVWHCTESLSELEAASYFSTDDQSEIDKATLPKRKIEKIITRILAQSLLKNNFGLDYHGLKKMKTGKPVLTDCKLEMSVSHCESYLTVLLSTADKAGIDIQNINPKIERIAPRIFSEHELEQINNNPFLLARAWSAKEAMFKYYEKGNINFIKDLHLSNIDNAEKFSGKLICNDTSIMVNFGSIQLNKNYQIVYCYED